MAAVDVDAENCTSAEVSAASREDDAATIRRIARMADSTGRRNTLITEVCDGTTEEADAASAGRGPAAVGCGQGDAGADAVTGTARAVAGGATRALAPDRDGDHDGGGGGWRGRVLA